MKYTFLGTSHQGKYEYYSGNLYVYQFKAGVKLGWLCSLPAWERTIYKILD